MNEGFGSSKRSHRLTFYRMPLVCVVNARIEVHPRTPSQKKKYSPNRIPPENLKGKGMKFSSSAVIEVNLCGPKKVCRRGLIFEPLVLWKIR